MILELRLTQYACASGEVRLRVWGGDQQQQLNQNVGVGKIKSGEQEKNKNSFKFDDY